MPRSKYCPLQNVPCSIKCAWYDEVGQCCEIKSISTQLCSLDNIAGSLDRLYKPEATNE